jgi:hypothetical protein
MHGGQLDSIAVNPHGKETVQLGKKNLKWIKGKGVIRMVT